MTNTYTPADYAKGLIDHHGAEEARTIAEAMLTLLGCRVHEFGYTGDAYDACQCRDDIRDGDTLHIPSEGVVALAGTWPCAVTEAFGKLHTLAEGTDPTFDQPIYGPVGTEAQCRAAVALATRLGYPVAAGFTRFVEA